MLRVSEAIQHFPIIVLQIMIDVLGLHTKMSWRIFHFLLESELHGKSEQVEYLWHFATDFFSMSQHVLENIGALN